MKNTLSKSLQDIFSQDVIVFVLKITFAALIISAVFIWLFGGLLSSMMISTFSWIPWEWLQETVAFLVNFLLYYLLIIIVISILTSLYIEPLLIKLAKKHYPNSPVVGSPNLHTSFLLSIKSAIIALLIFIFTFPLIFIPILGQTIYPLWIWSIIIKEPTVYDVSALFIADKSIIREKRKEARSIAMIASLFNYVPVLNIFSAVFAQILFLHHILGKENA
ncbi:MAG: hypothetical protein GQ531_03435 [Sulfurovum sp.]|nr:hypothetical protein [Sulfurovum sp.]